VSAQYLSISLAKGMRERQRKKKKHIRRPTKRKMTPDQIYTILGTKQSARSITCPKANEAIEMPKYISTLKTRAM
jgi:hypothetical protein